jgi:hypothetical protein
MCSTTSKKIKRLVLLVVGKTFIFRQLSTAHMQTKPKSCSPVFRSPSPTPTPTPTATITISHTTVVTVCGTSIPEDLPTFTMSSYTLLPSPHLCHVIAGLQCLNNQFAASTRPHTSHRSTQVSPLLTWWAGIILQRSESCSFISAFLSAQLTVVPRTLYL